LLSDGSPDAYATPAEDVPSAVGDRDESLEAANDAGLEPADDGRHARRPPPADVPVVPENGSAGAKVSATSRGHNGDLASPPESGGGAAEGDAGPAAAPPPPTEERSPGPPRRGWWKRLIE
jgi:hypothetical protein